jgi:hypothetical protein
MRFPASNSALNLVAPSAGSCQLLCLDQQRGKERHDVRAHLMDAFGVRTLLVPSTVALLGRWNWWPSRYGVPAEAAPDPEPEPTAVR